jgi:DNA-directed RNA polymerase beta subunit
MAGLNFSQQIEESTKNLTSLEQMSGKGLMQPFNGTNAGARKLMHNVHRDHVFPLMHGEKAIIETGYEIRFGDCSSSITRSDAEYAVVAKISKFSFAPNHHYWIIIQNIETGELDVVERISYHYITESYGYLYNNEYLDSLNIGDRIHNGDIVQKSLAFDEYNNRQDGINFNVAYLALDDNMEDSIVFREAAAEKFVSPLIKPVEIMINDNDIPLNIYGDDNVYKIIPDIGEEVKDANLIALRKEKKDESYFTQSVNRLRDIMISDDKKQVHGRVIDVNIYCNNPEILDSHYYAQLKMYYNEKNRCNKEIVQTLLPYASSNIKMTYDLQKLFANAKRIMNHDPYIDKRPFSNIILEIDVLEEKDYGPGDKGANRYGGKGVCSCVWPDSKMPRFKNARGEWEYVDVIFNSSTMVNRENVGQCFELELTHIGSSIIGKIIADKLNLDQAYNMILTYVNIVSPEQGEYMKERCSKMSYEELSFFIESIISSRAIHISKKPLTDPMTIDKLDLLYKTFPWVEQNKVEVPIVGSDGTTRYVPARRRIVIGKQYMFRLKQFAEEKFSATSLSATNIRNENTKSRVKKDYRELYPNTPIRFGNMETNNMAHIGIEPLIANMMIHSLSPQGRRLVEQMYTGDPFHVDIKLNSDSKNRSAEIVNTYLKAIGRRLKFTKTLKKINKITISPVSFDKDQYKKPIYFIPRNMRKGFDYEKEFKDMEKLNKQKEKKKAFSPVRFEGIRRRKE